MGGWSVSRHGPASYPLRGWRGESCTLAAHGGVIGGRCARCGKRAEKAAAAWAASIIRWEQPAKNPN